MKTIPITFVLAFVVSSCAAEADLEDGHVWIDDYAELTFKSLGDVSLPFVDDTEPRHISGIITSIHHGESHEFDAVRDALRRICDGVAGGAHRPLDCGSW